MDSNSPYIALLKQKLGADRFNHSLNVAVSARKLSEKYGGDAQRSYTAGLLHDIMKDASAEEQLAEIENAGFAVSEFERYNKKLLHAPSGAAFCETHLDIHDAEILNAIRYHTTGKQGMSLLEKIIYIADYISSDRTYNGIDKMRALSEISLEDAMRFGLEFTIMSLAQRGEIIHPDSVACYNELIINIKKGIEKQ